MGRPRLSEGKESDKISFRVTVDEKEKFLQKAEEKKINPSSVLRKHVQKFIKNAVKAKNT